MLKYLIPGAITIAGISFGIAVAGVLDAASSDPQLGTHTKAATPNFTEPPSPFVSDTGVLNSVTRDFGAPLGQTLGPDAEKWSDVLCEADAIVYPDSNGVVTGIESQGRKVSIRVGEQIVAAASFKDLAHMRTPVYRDGAGHLVLGYKYCKAADGEIQWIASSTPTPNQ